MSNNTIRESVTLMYDNDDNVSWEMIKQIYSDISNKINELVSKGMRDIQVYANYRVGGYDTYYAAASGYQIYYVRDMTQEELIKKSQDDAEHYRLTIANRKKKRLEKENAEKELLLKLKKKYPNI